VAREGCVGAGRVSVVLRPDPRALPSTRGPRLEVKAGHAGERPRRPGPARVLDVLALAPSPALHDRKGPKRAGTQNPFHCCCPPAWGPAFQGERDMPARVPALQGKEREGRRTERPRPPASVRPRRAALPRASRARGTCPHASPALRLGLLRYGRIAARHVGHAGPGHAVAYGASRWPSMLARGLPSCASTQRSAALRPAS
jgi:hypothetical protein